MRDETEPAVSAELDVGEALLWCGRPRDGIRLMSFDGLFILLTLGMPSLALVVIFRNMGPPSLVSICWLVCVCGGLAFVFGRFVAAKVRRGRTFYGLTPRRAIILSGLFGRRVRSIDIASLGEISLVERPDGSGTISLRPPTLGLFVRPSGARGLFGPNTTLHVPDAFETIENARRVYDQLREQQRLRNSPDQG